MKSHSIFLDIKIYYFTDVMFPHFNPQNFNSKQAILEYFTKLF